MKIKYVIKFVSKEEYADKLLAGILFMHTARYYHLLEQENGIGQGDLREGRIIPEIRMYKNTNYPIYCLYSVYDEEIDNLRISIPKQVVSDFHCETGYLVLIDFDAFESELYSSSCGYELGGGGVTYKTPSKETSLEWANSDNAINLLTKDPFFKHQKEFRLIVYKDISSDKNPKAYIEIPLLHNIKEYSVKIAINSLEVDDNYYYINLRHYFIG